MEISNDMIGLSLREMLLPEPMIYAQKIITALTFFTQGGK